MLRRTLPAVVVLFALIGAFPAAEVNLRDTRLLHQPATSGTHVAFVYAEDLWVARIDGTDLRRLTTDEGAPGGVHDAPHAAVHRVDRPGDARAPADSERRERHLFT